MARKYVFECENCPKCTEDIYIKGWVHFDGHLAVSFGREAKERDSRGISDAIDGEWYFCSWDCFGNYIALHLAWNDPRKMGRHDGA